MSQMIAPPLVAELEHEMANTRRLLERLNEDKFDFKPHEKSMSLGQLASHVVETIEWTVPTVKQDVLVMGPDYKSPSYGSVAELIAALDKATETAKAAIAETDDSAMQATWTMKGADGTVYMALPRIATLRGFVFSHHYHHRGQLEVYARMTGSLLPAIYGPSADEGMPS